MSLLAPWMLVGLVATAVPLLIHLVGRARAPQIPFAAVDFLLRSNRRMARWLQLRHLLLLLARCALIVGVVLMMAKPAWETLSDLPAIGGGSQSAVLIIDDTLSMTQEVDGKTLFERAKKKGREVLRLLGPQASVALLSVGRPEGPVARLSRDARHVRYALDGLGPTFRHAQLDHVLQRAFALLSNAPASSRHVFVISDFAAHGLSRPVPQVPSGLSLHALDVAVHRPQDNLAVVDLAAATLPSGKERAVRVTARACNYGARATRTELALFVDGEMVVRGSIELPARQCATKLFYHSFPRAGFHQVEVTLPPDALMGDNRRFLGIQVRSDIRVLLVNGSPSPVRHLDELFYLETALERPAPGKRRILPETLRPHELTERRLSACDVVVLANVRILQPKQAAALTTFVHKGGGLFITVGDAVRAESFNETMGKLLPQKLRGAMAASGPASGQAALRVGRVDSEHPVIHSIWTHSQESSGLMQARFFRTFRLQPEGMARRKVLIWFDDSSPALVEARRGSGRVLLFASSIDRDWNDLAIQPAYLPLVQQIVRYLGQTPLDEPERSLFVGKTEVVTVPAQTVELRLVAPAGHERIWTRQDLKGRESVEVQADSPGFYSIWAGSARGGSRRLSSQSFVANVDPAESNLAKGKLKTPTVHASTRRAKAVRRVELWHGVGLVLLLLLLMESALGRRA